MRYVATLLLSLALFMQVSFHSAHAETGVASAVLDVDGNGQKEPLSDGILILRYLFDFRGAALIDQAIGTGATRTTAGDIEAYLASQLSVLDIDGNGVTEPLSDGLLTLRYLFDFRGSALIDQAVGGATTRTTSASIEEYLEDLSLIVDTTKIIISGKAVDDSIVNVNVVIKNLSGITLGTGITGNDGSYSIEVNESDITSGYQVIVSGGQVTGELRALYSTNDDKGRANVTLITSLIYSLLKDRSTINSLSVVQRDVVIKELVSIGMITKNDFYAVDSAFINEAQLKDSVKENGGLSNWIKKVSEDLNDGELSGDLMLGFPKAHGGIINLSIDGGKNSISVLKGDKYAKKVIVSKYNPDSTYTYHLLGAPEGVLISDEGVLSLGGISDAFIKFKIQVLNTDTSLGRLLDLSVKAVASEVIASGIIGSEGGLITDDWEELIATVPAGAVSGQSVIKILRSINENGFYTYSVSSSLPLFKMIDLRVPQSDFYKRSNLKRRGISRSNVRLQERRVLTEDWSEWFATDERIPKMARFAEVKAGSFLVANPTNRLKIKAQALPLHPNLKAHILDASRLFSLCGDKADYDSNCSEKSPVLFVHGFSARGKSDFGGASHGGGEGTWGQFPELIYKEGKYAVFEFTWRTAARFVDVAADLADAIKLIETVSGKKVNVVAHSFGGLLTRTYLQGYAVGRPYENNVQSLVTMGTPHSGIFDSNGVHGGISFPKGQHSFSFEGCLQSSCNQAGESVPHVWNVPASFPLSCVGSTFAKCKADMKKTNMISISDYMGVNGSSVGELPVKIAKMEDGHKMPVDTLVLIGLTIDRASFSNVGVGDYAYVDGLKDAYEGGDQLISYAGQRFLPSLGGSRTTESPVYENGSITVVEKLLGIHYGALPGEEVPLSEAFNDNLGRITFEGYRHSGSNAGQGVVGGFTSKGDAGEPKVENGNNLGDTGKIHASLFEVKKWLAEHPSEDIDPKLLDLNLWVIDASAEQPISGAHVRLGAGHSSMAGGYTDSKGLLSLKVPFLKKRFYGAAVSADGYHFEFFNKQYFTRSTILSSSKEFGVLALYPDQAVRGVLGGKVIDSVTKEPISNVSVIIKRNGIIKETKTDSDGNYLVDNLINGNYEVIMTKTDYRDSSSSNVSVLAVSSTPFNVSMVSDNPPLSALNGKILEESNEWRAKITIGTLLENKKSANIEFRDLSCGGDLTYLHKENNGYFFNETITYGSCVQNCQVWIKLDGSEYKEFCNGSFTGGGDLEEMVSDNPPLSALNGKILEESDEWRAKITIGTLLENKKSANIEFRDLSCGGDLTYLHKENNGYFFNETITYGPCVQNCQVWIKLDGSEYKEFCNGSFRGGGDLEEMVSDNPPLSALNGKILEESDEWRAKITIGTLLENKKSANIEFRDLSCGGDLTYLRKKDNGYFFNETITYGTCVQNCQVWIKLDGSEYKEFCNGSFTGGGDLEEK